jgi:hypothetical protein
MAELSQCCYHPPRILALFNQVLWTYSATQDSIHILFTFLGIGSLTTYIVSLCATKEDEHAGDNKNGLAA